MAFLEVHLPTHTYQLYEQYLLEGNFIDQCIADTEIRILIDGILEQEGFLETDGSIDYQIVPSEELEKMSARYGYELK